MLWAPALSPKAIAGRGVMIPTKGRSGVLVGDKPDLLFPPLNGDFQPLASVGSRTMKFLPTHTHTLDLRPLSPVRPGLTTGKTLRLRRKTGRSSYPHICDVPNTPRFSVPGHPQAAASHRRSPSTPPGALAPAACARWCLRADWGAAHPVSTAAPQKT